MLSETEIGLHIYVIHLIYVTTYAVRLYYRPMMTGFKWKENAKLLIIDNTTCQLNITKESDESMCKHNNIRMDF